MSSVAPPLRVARTSAAVGFALQGFFLAVILTQLPQFKDHYGFSDGLIVVVAVTISLLAGVGSVLAEHLAHRWSSRATLRIGLLAIAACGVGIALSPGIATLFVTFACYGIGVGIVDASTNMQGVSIQHSYGKVILSSFYAAWSAGAIAGALFVSLCSATHLSLRLSILIAAAVVGVVGTAIASRLLATGHEPAEREKLSIATPMPQRPFWILGVAMALVFAIDLTIGNWSALYVENLLFSSASTAALALAAYQSAALVSRLTGDLWVRKFGELAVVRLGGAIGVLGFLLVVLAPNPAIAITGFLVVGLGVPVIAPLCFSAAGRLVPPHGRDALIARLNIFNYAGTLVGGGVVGALAAASTLRIGFALPLLFAVALILLAPAFRPGSWQTPPISN